MAKALRWPGVLALAMLCAAPAVEARTEVWLWAWERPEDLRFVPEETGVAFLAETVSLADAAFVRRRQPLRVRDAQPLMAVVRVENSRRDPVALAPGLQRLLVDRVVAAAEIPGVRAVQIDFDAAVSQRGAYRAVLAELRAKLPPQMRLSITALASWCQFDRWVDVDPWPADEIVPMLFEMGREADDVRRWVEREGNLRSPRCAHSAGVMVGEPLVVPTTARRVFVFNPKPWTPEAFADVQRRLG